ncbi:MAG: GAF domain-containing protein [Turneriella sp.]
MIPKSEIQVSDLVKDLPGRRVIHARDVKLVVNRLNKLSLIMQVSRTLMGSTDVKRLLGEILDKARIVMNADKASIFMIDEARNEIYASVTLDGSEIRLARGSGIIGFVADSGETVNIPDAYADARFNRDNDTKTGYRTQSILCMPVRDHLNKNIGALQVLNKQDGGSFTHEDEEMLSAFIGMVGVCLENARAYAELAAEKDSLEDKVVERTAELALAKAETDQILRAVEEGLFLLHRGRDNYIIGAGHSEALCRIFEQDELRSKSFLPAIAAFLDKAVVEKVQLFLELMFDPKQKQAVLLKLNPLNRVAATFNPSAAKKYLRFYFSRVMGSDARVDHLMVTVADISQEVELKEKLQRTEEQNRRHMEVLLAILQSNPATLSEFLSDLDEDLQTARQIFAELSSEDADSALAKLADFYRLIHSVKGNSSLLNFQSLTDMAHHMESSIEAILHRGLPDAEDLSGIDRDLNELEALADELRGWLTKIATFQTEISAQQQTDFVVLALQKAIEKAAHAEQRRVRFDCAGFSPQSIGPEIRKPLKDILVQMVRNAVIHGIEASAERVATGKSEEGLIVLRSSTDSGKLTVTLEDDGRGIDLTVLVQQLIAQKRVSAEQAEQMTDDEKMQFIYIAGVSTRESVSEMAGRGMGMSIVEKNARRIAATVTTESKKGAFTRFTIIIPRENVA